MDLCHIKNSQLGKEFWIYKGCVVFRGDIVKNEMILLQLSPSREFGFGCC